MRFTFSGSLNMASVRCVRTQAAPIPLPAPVTRTVLFSKRFIGRTPYYYLLRLNVSCIHHRPRVLPYHQACGGTAEPQNRVGNFLGATKSADRYVFQHARKGVWLGS